MGRYSPAVLPDTGESFTNQLGRALAFMRQSRLDKRAQEREDRESEWLTEERRRQREAEDLALQERGYRRFEQAPTVQRRPETPPVFEGAHLGLADREQPLLGRMLGGWLEEKGPGRPVALPGQFILTESGGDFIPSTVYAGGSPLPPEIERIKTPDFNPNAYRDRLDLGSRRTYEAPDPRYEHMTGSIYRDLEGGPEGRMTEQANLLAEALGTLRGEDPSNAALARLMLSEDLPASVLTRFLAPQEEEGFTAEELRAAGIEEPMLAVALRDPILARRLIEREMEPPEETSMIRIGGRDFPNTLQGAEQALTWEREISAAGRAPRGTSDTGDPSVEERRKALLSEGMVKAPVTPVQQDALDFLAEGVEPDQVLLELEADGYSPAEVLDAEEYMRSYTLRRRSLMQRAREEEGEGARVPEPGFGGFLARLLPGGQTGYQEPTEPDPEARAIALRQLRSGLSVEEIISQMQEYDVPESVVEDVRRYLSRQRGR